MDSKRTTQNTVYEMCARLVCEYDVHNLFGY